MQVAHVRWTPRASGLALFVSLLLAALPAVTLAESPPLPASEQVLVLAPEGYPSRHDLVVHPDDPQTLYWTVGEAGVLKSSDGGATWVPKNFGLPHLGVVKIAMHPTDPNHLVVGFDGNLHTQGAHPYRSTDGGERWEPVVVCEHQNGNVNLNNLRQASTAERLLFDPMNPSYFYFLVHAQHTACGGFYRSCDGGVSFDRNPRCDPVPRPSCAAGDPEPTIVDYITSNDASILEVHPTAGTLWGTTGIHHDECALKTSRDRGAVWKWEDVLDTRGTFVDPADQAVSSLFVKAVAIAPSDGEVRYAAPATSFVVCSDGKAHPGGGFWCPDDRLNQPGMVARWFDEMSGAVDCDGTNDCDNDAQPDRVWRPLFDGAALGNHIRFTHLLVHPLDPDRVFATSWGFPNRLVMLNPADPDDPTVTPWQATDLLTSSTLSFTGLVRDPASPDRFYVLGTDTSTAENRILRFESDDGWQSWQQVDFARYQRRFQVYDLLESAGSAGRQIVAGTSDGLFLADPLGAEWTSGPPNQAAALAVAPSDPDRTYAKIGWATWIGESGFESVTMMDREWERQFVMCTDLFHQIEVDPDDPGRLYAATGAGIWTLPNAHTPADGAGIEAIGGSWLTLARQPEGLADEYIWSLEFDPADPSHNTLLAGSRSGAIYLSVDRGLSWSPATVSGSAEFLAELSDVRDVAFQGGRGFAATAAGVLRRGSPGADWAESLAAGRVSRLSRGASGLLRVYAAGADGVYRTRDGGESWELLPLDVGSPHGTVLESTTDDGRHHLWVSESGFGLYRVSTTMAARPGADAQSVFLDWTEADPSAFAGYRLHYGSDPDLLGGTEADQGPSPIGLGQVTTALLSGLDFSAGPIYVALQGVDDAQQVGALGLPLRIDFDVIFAAELTVFDPGGCPDPLLTLDWETLPAVSVYEIHRSEAGAEGPFTLIAEIGPEETAYTDAEVSEGVPYWYRVTTRFSGGQATESNVVDASASSDSDGDGMENCVDNCPGAANEDQTDTDGDLLGDACDPDDDGDGYEDADDNCPLDFNPDQANLDGDAWGDVCDLCPETFTQGPFGNRDPDGDGAGNACDCAPHNGTAFALPPESSNLRFEQGPDVLSWDDDAAECGSGITHDVLRGQTSDLPVNDAVSESCLASGEPGTMFEDNDPAISTGFYYLVRGRNVCGVAGWGQTSAAEERTSTACP
jgi:hypothetical protein